MNCSSIELLYFEVRWKIGDQNLLKDRKKGGEKKKRKSKKRIEI